MDRLRDGFVDFMRLRGYAERTVEAYTAAAGKAVRFCGDKPPRRIEENEISAYLLHLKEGRVCPHPVTAGAQATNRRREHAEAAPDPSADPLAELLTAVASHRLRLATTPPESAISFNPQGH